MSRAGKPGFSIFRGMKQDSKTKDIPVIMVTGIGDAIGIKFSKEDMCKFLGGEPEGYLEKPVDPKTLQNAIRKVLES